MSINDAFIAYNAASLTYTINPGASTSAIQAVINAAAPGSTLFFTAGTHVLTDTLNIDRGDIAFQGAGRGETVIRFEMSEPGYGMHFQGSTTGFESGLAADVSAGSRTIRLENTSGLKAGDFLQIQQANTDEFLLENGYDNVVDTSYQDKLPLHESLVEIESVSGNTVTLKNPVTHDMEGAQTTAVKLDLLKGIRLDGFTVTYNLGTPDAENFDTTLPDWTGKISLYPEKTTAWRTLKISRFWKVPL